LSLPPGANDPLVERKSTDRRLFDPNGVVRSAQANGLGGQSAADRSTLKGSFTDPARGTGALFRGGMRVARRLIKLRSVALAPDKSTSPPAA